MENDELIRQRGHFKIEEAIFILLMLLSLAGIGITDFSPDDGYGYWLIMVFVFGLLAFTISWLQAKNGLRDFGAIAKQQSLHWLISLVVVCGAFLLQKSGRLDETSASQVILLLLSLSTMLDGIRVGWHLTVVGFFLGACSVIIAYVEQFMLASGLLAAFIIACSLLWEFWLHKRVDS